LAGNSAGAAIVAAITFLWLRPAAAFYAFVPVWGALLLVPSGVIALGAQWARHRKEITARLSHVTNAGQRLAAWNAPLRLDVVCGEAWILATGEILAGRFIPGGWLPPGVAIAPVLCWLLARGGLAVFRRNAGLGWLGTLIGIAGLTGVGRVLFPLAGKPISRSIVVAWCWITLALIAYRWAFAPRRDRPAVSAVENARWLLLGSGWLFLLRPFFVAAVHGTGDAFWYAQMMADAVEQGRAGVFPVFAGQTIHQFNGAIFIVRFAPGILTLGGLVDLATARCLSPVVIQNLILSLTGLAAMISAYAVLALLLPRRRWRALALALLYITCPGVLGLVFNTDLFMSWMTVPLIPLVYYGVVRSFERSDLASMILIGASLGAMWWGHSPIALWTTLLVGASQAIRLAVQGLRGKAVGHALVGGLIFGLG
jgi:hypothetical protein